MASMLSNLIMKIEWQQQTGQEWQQQTGQEWQQQTGQWFIKPNVSDEKKDQPEGDPVISSVDHKITF